MPSVTIELTTELAGRMCNFVHTAMMDGGAGLIGEPLSGRSMMRSIILIGTMETSEAASAIVEDTCGQLRTAPGFREEGLPGSNA
jgi:hypothetical protein